MRSLTITGWYPSLLQPANGDFVQEQVRLLRHHGLHVDLLFADLNVAYLGNGQLSKQKSIVVDDNGNYDYVVSGPTWPKNCALGLNHWIKNYVVLSLQFISIYGKPDIIHAHTYLGAIVACEIKKETHIPVIATEHYTGWLDSSIRPLHKKKSVVAFQNVNQVTAVSTALAHVMQEELNIEVQVLPNYIDTSVFTIRKRNESSVLRLVCVGELIKRKQVDHAIRVLYHLNKTDCESYLTIVGAGSEKSALQSLAKQLNVQDKISWTGRVTNTEVASILQYQDLLIHTSDFETFGLVIVEALCVGVPVVSYKNQGNREFLDLPGVHVSAKKNPKVMAQVILKQKDGILNQSIIEIGRSAQDAFGAARIIPRLLSLYKEIQQEG